MTDNRTWRSQDCSSYEPEFRQRYHVSSDSSSRDHSCVTQLTDSLSRGVDASGRRHYVRAHDDPQYRTNAAVEGGKLGDGESKDTHGIIATDHIGRASSIRRPDAEEVQSTGPGRSPLSVTINDNHGSISLSQMPTPVRSNAASPSPLRVVINDNHGSITLSQMLTHVQSNASGRSPLSVIINDNHGRIILSPKSTPVQDESYRIDATNESGLTRTEQPTTLARKPTLMDKTALSDHISSRPEGTGSSKGNVEVTDEMVHAPYHGHYDGRARRGRHRGYDQGDLDLPADGGDSDETDDQLSYY